MALRLCAKCEKLVTQDRYDQLYATHPADRNPWRCDDGFRHSLSVFRFTVVHDPLL